MAIALVRGSLHRRRLELDQRSLAPIQSYTLPERLRIWSLLPVVRLFGPVNAIVTGIRDVLLSPTTCAQDPEAARLAIACAA
jgi:hypothetical protein